MTYPCGYTVRGWGTRVEVRGAEPGRRRRDGCPAHGARDQPDLAPGDPGRLGDRHGARLLRGHPDPGGRARAPWAAATSGPERNSPRPSPHSARSRKAAVGCLPWFGPAARASGPVLRSGARPGDVLVLAGTVGRAAAGLEILMDRQGAFPMPVPGARGGRARVGSARGRPVGTCGLAIAPASASPSRTGPCRGRADRDDRRVRRTAQGRRAGRAGIRSCHRRRFLPVDPARRTPAEGRDVRR
jgi:hypothetical protein